jgi:ABC-2 type transport system ATP-binding protein
MSQKPIITVRNLTRRFGEIVAVADLSLEIRRGEIFGFLGHNGAGKTTTVRLLNGVLEADEGDIEVLGYDARIQGAALRRHTGVLTETPALEERLTGRQNLHIYANLFDVPSGEVAERATSLLAAFGLAERADEKVGAYSKGMKQRLALARALLHAPEILFLDEPTAGLDPVVSRQVHDLIRRLSKEEGRTIFLCTHNLAEAQALCDRVGVMEHGRLIALGTPGELARRLQPHRRLEVELDGEQVARAIRILSQIDGLQVEPAGEQTIALQGIGREHIPAILSRLLNTGIGIYRVAPQEPNLADVYFALHAREPAVEEE